MKHSQFSILALLIVTAIVALGIVSIDLLTPRIRATGGGMQTISISFQPNTIHKLDLYLLRPFSDPNQIIAALKSQDQAAVCQYINPEQHLSFPDPKSLLEVEFYQQWSETINTLTDKQESYSQTYQHAVVNVQNKDGSFDQRLVELPERHRKTTIDLSRESNQ
ncbi:MAG: hypothetical protein AAGA30_15385 [Planctomycetota bacterium]